MTRSPAVWARALTALFIAVYAGLVLQTGRQVLTGKRSTGDFIHFHTAAVAMTRGEDIYAAGERGYIYPPLVAFLFQPLSGLTLPRAAALWMVANGALLAGAAWASARAAADRPLSAIHRGGGGKSGRTEDGRANPQSAIAAWALIGSLVLVDKIRSDLRLGQTDGLVILPIALALFWLDRRPWRAGIMLGVAGAVKYIALAFVPYLILRKRWRAAVSTLVAWTACMFIPALSTGWDRNAVYVRAALGGLAAMLNPSVGGERAGSATDPGAVAGIAGVGWDRSVSLTSACMRLAETTGNKILALLGLVAIALACLGIAWVLIHRSGLNLLIQRGIPLDATEPGCRVLVLGEWIGLLIATLVFSPQVTARHFVFVLPLAVLSAAIWLQSRDRAPRLWIIAGVIVFVAGLYLPPGGVDALEPALWAWRGVAGASWCLLIFFFLTLASLLHCIQKQKA